MSEEQGSPFDAVFDEFLGQVSEYNSVQQAKILELTKNKLKALLLDFGTPEAEPKKAAAPTPAAPAAAAPTAAAPAPAAAAADPVTGSRVSTRVAAPPGGKTSVVLGGGDDNAARPGTKGRKLYSQANDSSISFGGDGAAEKTSVKVHHAPGGGSSISFGDDSSAPAERPATAKKPQSNDQSAEPTAAAKRSTRVAQVPGGKSSISFGADESQQQPAHTSVRTHQPSGGKSSVELGSDDQKAPAAAQSGGDSADLPKQLLSDIGNAIQRKGKTKDTFTKFTGNKTKNLLVEDLQVGIASLGFPTFSLAQATALVKLLGKDPKEGLGYSDFVRLLSLGN